MMAYTPFYPTYSNYANYYPQNYQPVVQPQAQQQMASPSGIIWVAGAQEAQMYPVAPNNAVALWENSGKTIFLKSADATGKPTMRIYDLVERSQIDSDVPHGQEEKTISYATKDDLGKVVGAVQSIDSIIGSLKTDIETMKGDLYGVAGRKKMATKRKEEVEDEE